MSSPPSQEGEKKGGAVPSGTSPDEAVGSENPKKRRRRRRRNPDKESQGAHSSPREAGGGPKDSPVKEDLSEASEVEDSRRRGNPDRRSQGAHTSPPGAGGGPGDSSVKEEDVQGTEKEDGCTPGEPGTLTPPQVMGGGPGDPNGDKEESITDKEEVILADEKEAYPPGDRGTLTSPHEAGGGPGDPNGVKEEKRESVATEVEEFEGEDGLWGKADASIRCKGCRVRGHGADDCHPRNERKCWRCGQSIRKTARWHKGYRETRRCGFPDPLCDTCAERRRECEHVPGDRDLCLPRGPWVGPPRSLWKELFSYYPSSDEMDEEDVEEEDISEDDETSTKDTEEDEDTRREGREDLRRAREIVQLWITGGEVGKKKAQRKGEISPDQMVEEYDEEEYETEVD